MSAEEEAVVAFPAGVTVVPGSIEIRGAACVVVGTAVRADENDVDDALSGSQSLEENASTLSADVIDAPGSTTAVDDGA
jgi:hypothetical protein